MKKLISVLAILLCFGWVIPLGLGIILYFSDDSSANDRVNSITKQMIGQDLLLLSGYWITAASIIILVIFIDALIGGKILLFIKNGLTKR